MGADATALKTELAVWFLCNIKLCDYSFIYPIVIYILALPCQLHLNRHSFKKKKFFFPLHIKKNISNLSTKSLNISKQKSTLQPTELLIVTIKICNDF